MSYYESIQNLASPMITYRRALTELAAHGIDAPESIDTFMNEAWTPHTQGGLIDARHVLDWLGY